MSSHEAQNVKKTVYDIITEYILERLEKGTVPWQKPWHDAGPPKNLISGKSYRGINSFLLGCAEFSSPFFASFNQVKDLGGFVKKGAKSLPCVFWTLYETEDRETGKPINVPVLRYYRVFNTDQCEGLNHKRLAELQAVVRPEKAHVLADADCIIEHMPNKPAIMHGGPRAYYRPSTDSVTIPPSGLFDSPEAYYATLFHELTHATGHESRLARKSIKEHNVFGSYEYGQEELVAEMGSAFLCGHCHIEKPVIDNSASYIQSWIKTIKASPKLVVIAAAQAQKATSFS